MTPFASVAILEKLALLKIAFCKAPVFNKASVCRTPMFTSAAFALRLFVVDTCPPVSACAGPVGVHRSGHGSLQWRYQHSRLRRFQRVSSIEQSAWVLRQTAGE